jgi:hypothetical protein
LTAYISNFLQDEVSFEAVTGLRQTRVGPPPESVRQIRLTASLIERLYRAFVKRNHLTENNKREISWDAAKRVAVLSLQASRLDKREALGLFLESLKIDRRILYPSAIFKGVHQALIHRTATKPDRKFKAGTRAMFLP